VPTYISLQEQFQQSQQPDSSPWPDPFAKPYLSPVPIPQVPPLGAQVGLSHPLQQPSPQAADLPHVSQQPAAVASSPTFPGGQGASRPRRYNYAAKATDFLARIQEELRLGDIQVELTRDNYKEKLHKLLCWEEKAHIEILGGR